MHRSSGCALYYNELKEIVRDLAEAQKKTEAEIRTLTITVKNIQKELGGISNTIGYELEDRFYHIFPSVLKEDFNLKAHLGLPCVRLWKEKGLSCEQ